MGNTTDGERWVSQAKIDEAAVLNRLGEALVALRPLEQATFCRVNRRADRLVAKRGTAAPNPSRLGCWSWPGGLPRIKRCWRRALTGSSPCP